MRKTGAVLLALGASTAILSSTAAVSDDTLDRALSLAAEERYRESRQVLDPLLGREPGNPHGWLLHGILRAQEGNRQEAIGVFRELTHDFPDMFEAYNNLAVLYVGEGRLEDARSVLLAILERRPEAVGYRNLGKIYAQLAHRAYARSRELATGGITHADASRERGAPASDTRRAAPSAAATGAPAQAPGADGSGQMPEGPPDAASMTDAVCVVAGEFRDPRVAEDARQWLQLQGAELVTVSRQAHETVKNYRVYLPPFKSRRGAEQKAHELRARGIRDVAIVLSGSLKNAVSLGVYASKANVEKRVASLARLGYSVSSAANASVTEEYVMLEAHMNGEPDELRDAWISRFPRHSIRHVDCG